MAGEKVLVVGAGPVGSLAALYAASRGFEVEVYELRGDLRETETTPLNFTKSINLALSERGINALRSSGHPTLLDDVVQHTLPMHGRMIHSRNAVGRLTEESQLYDVHGRALLSVDRGGLNKLILNELGAMPNVKLFFHHKLTGADFKNKKAWLEIQPDGSPSPDRAREIEVAFDLLIGADGAHSAVRHHLMKYARMQYEQRYIDCLWCEFTISTSKAGSFRISPNHLHIWPGGSLMFIALPNLDKSFTCTLFAPVAVIEQLERSTDAGIVSFFDSKFPGVSDHIPPEELVAQFRRNPHLPLVSIKCSPYHFRDSVVILGDAANAMVPFYGQGMNAGLESVRELFGELDAWTQGRQSREEALAHYESGRVRNLHAVSDLSLANYVEMRSSVTSWTYKLRKYIEESLDKYFPRLGWSTQYTRVSFSNTPYSEVIERSEHQKRVLTALSVVTVGQDNLPHSAFHRPGIAPTYHDQPGYGPAGVSNHTFLHPGYHQTYLASNEYPQLDFDAAGVQNNQTIPDGSYTTPAGLIVYKTSAVLPDDSTVTVTKGCTLYDAIGNTNIDSSSTATLLVVHLKVTASLLPATHRDFNKTDLPPRMGTVHVDYMSTERMFAMHTAKTSITRGAGAPQPSRLCFKCLAYDRVSANPQERKLDLTLWNRSNPMRHILEWHPLRMVMQAAIPIEVTWHKRCLQDPNNPNKALAKVREEWVDSTHGALFKEIDEGAAAALLATPGVPVVTLYSVLPPPVSANWGRGFDYPAYAARLWDSGVAIPAEMDV
ncbi:hypothetical protein DV738_g3505, partial [Chaetothyriales sp. CBS 135597]